MRLMLALPAMVVSSVLVDWLRLRLIVRFSLHRRIFGNRTSQKKTLKNRPKKMGAKTFAKVLIMLAVVDVSRRLTG